MSIPEHLKNKKICIYTVNYGNYDNFLKHAKQDIPCHYIYFTDNTQNNIQNDEETIVLNEYPINKINYPIEEINKNITNVVLFRTDLFLIEKLKEYDICIYIDGNAKILKENFIREILTEENMSNDLIISRHPERNCAYQEAIFCLTYDKYTNTDLQRQIDDYKKDNYPIDNGLYWNGFIIYLNPFSEKMKLFYDTYTEHMIKYTKNPKFYSHPQGQVSLPYVLWKTNMKYKVLPNQYNTHNNGNIQIHYHLRYT